MVEGTTAQFTSPKAKFEFNLEALRGIAALIVVVRHAILFPDLLLKGYKVPDSWSYIPPGHLSVLLFFTLSGYVIGLTNKKPIRSWASCKDYLQRRFVRLYPIYLISIALTLAVAFAIFHKEYSLGLISKHLFFLQVTFGPVFEENPALWSLNYEVFYYLLFIVTSFFSIRPVVIIVASFLVAVAATALPGWLSPMLPAYAYGLIFWTTGLWLARHQFAAVFDQTKRFSYFISFIFLFLSFERMNILKGVFDKANFNIPLERVANAHQQIVDFSDLSYFLFCITGILLFANKKSRFHTVMLAVIYAAPLFYLLVYAATGKLFTVQGITLVITAIFYLLSLVFLAGAGRLNAISQNVITRLIPLGSISYGIYVVHFPILVMIGSFAAFSGTSVEFVLRLVVYLAITFAVGYLLEIKLQPFFRNLFIKPVPVTPLVNG